MDEQALLAAFDEQVRRRPRADTAQGRVEREAGIVRVVSSQGWTGVTWSDLDDSTADAAIAAQVRRFRRLRRSWEWKHYSYDCPSDLPARLVDAGLRAEPAETLLVAEIAALDLDVPPPEGVRLVPVEDQSGIDALVRVHEEVFAGDSSAVGAALAAGLGRRSGTVAGVVALAAGRPVAAGRLELPTDTDFASLWGGGTVPAWRGRGVFRSLVAYRGALAAAAGFRFLQVDASSDSRPVLARLGFVALATTTPYVHPGDS